MSWAEFWDSPVLWFPRAFHAFERFTGFRFSTKRWLSTHSRHSFPIRCTSLTVPYLYHSFFILLYICLSLRCLEVFVISYINIRVEMDRGKTFYTSFKWVLENMHGFKTFCYTFRNSLLTMLKWRDGSYSAPKLLCLLIILVSTISFFQKPGSCWINPITVLGSLS